MGAAEKDSMAKKSALRTLKPSEVLFNDGDFADSLFIIQKGQLRLYKPKGRGFIELAVLRAGEVIGEMAYFDEDGSGRKRSCAASAMVTTEIIEISFKAFGKQMASLNPWFKTIINTLAKRLRKTNARVRELESNNATASYATGKHGDYEFLKANDVIKVLGTLFLVLKSHGEQVDQGLSVHRKVMNLYAHDIFTVMEVKLDAVVQVLCNLGHMQIIEDGEGMPNVYVVKNLELLRQFFIHYNTEKYVAEEKRLEISGQCEQFLEKINDQMATKDYGDKQKAEVPISEILDDFKTRNVGINIANLEDARVHGILGEVIVGNDNLMSVEVMVSKFRKLMPIIRFMNKVLAANKEKAS